MSGSSNILGLGVIGVGDVAQRVYLDEMAPFGSRFRWVGFCDVKAEFAGRAAEKYGGEFWTEDYHELLAHADIDAVLILTTNDAKYEACMAALDSGKHVFVEKTAGQTGAEVDRLIARSRQRNLVLACPPAILMASVCQMMKKALDAGSLGRICFARAQTRGLGPADSKVRATDPRWYYGSTCGPLYDRGVYILHILVGLLGAVRRVSAFESISLADHVIQSGETRGQRMRTESPDNIHLLLEFEDSVLATLNSTFCAPATQAPDMEIFGDRGAIAADWHLRFPTFRLYNHETGEWLSEQPDSWSLADGVKAFLDAVQGGAPLPYTAEQARHVVDVMDCARRSAKDGRAVEVKFGL